MSGFDLFVQMLPLLLIFPLLYFFFIRPQRKKDKETAKMRNSIKVGDEIITIGGICGKVVKTKEDSLTIAVGADKVKFEIMRWAVSKVTAEAKSTKGAAPAEVAEDTPTKKSLPRRIKRSEASDDEDIKA